MKKYHFVIADVFTDTPFGGNQLAVFVDGRDLTDQQMQKLAQEMNYSETTFLSPTSRPDCEFRVRIFTPTQELPFAGHPLIGTGYVLGARNLVGLQGKTKQIKLDVKVGVVPIELQINKGVIERTVMTQPTPQFIKVFEDQITVAQALGIPLKGITDTGLPIEVISTGLPVMIIPVRSLDLIGSLKVNPAELSEVCHVAGAKTALVFTRETVLPSAQVHCRVFAPEAGVMEDAATGSANGPLGCYLVKHGLIATPPRTTIVSEQGLEMDRPSLLYLDVEGEGDQITTVRVSGDVVIVGEGDMFIGI